MNTPFTVEQFLGVFERYNLAVWPMQVVLNLLGVAAITLAFKRTSFANAAVTIVLAFLWLWIGIVYHFVWSLVGLSAAIRLGSVKISDFSSLAWLPRR